ncbi:MAG TPA: hypothetical protein VFK27_00620 [Bacillales bacterium]|nr:hypothetical protein [Bacillales bacterium]
MAEQWLEQFFKIVDFGRRERGKQLYKKNKLLNFRKNPGGDGFTAKVKGSGDKIYRIEAYYPQVDEGMPDIEEMKMNCTCPDWVEFCKHSVCAVMCLAKNANGESVIWKDVSPEVDEAAEKISLAMKRDMETLRDLGEPPFLRGTGQFLEMHKIIRKKLRAGRL